jgi:hypothetical protein
LPGARFLLTATAALTPLLFIAQVERASILVSYSCMAFLWLLVAHLPPVSQLDFSLSWQ